MFRRVWAAVFAVMLVPWLGLRAMAAEGAGSIRVTLQQGERTVGGAVMLYRVGEPGSEGYRLAESYGGGIVREADAQSPYLAQWLAEIEGEEGTPRILDADGSAEFSQLAEGLYLLVQTETEEGFQAIKPFLVELPCQGQWNVQAYPKTQQMVTQSPATGQHPAPILGAMGMVLAGVGLVLCADRRRKK